MLLWQTSAIKPEDVEALAAHAKGAAECLIRDDKKGSFILCDRGKAPKGVIEKRLMPLFSAGRFGPEAGPWIFAVGIWMPKDWREEFCAWYQYEHGPMLLECREWKGFQFFETPTNAAASFMCCTDWQTALRWTRRSARLASHTVVPAVEQEQVVRWCV